MGRQGYYRHLATLVLDVKSSFSCLDYESNVWSLQAYLQVSLSCCGVNRRNCSNTVGVSWRSGLFFVVVKCTVHVKFALSWHFLPIQKLNVMVGQIFCILYQPVENTSRKERQQRFNPTKAVTHFFYLFDNHATQLEIKRNSFIHFPATQGRETLVYTQAALWLNKRKM